MMEQAAHYPNGIAMNGQHAPEANGETGTYDGAADLAAIQASTNPAPSISKSQATREPGIQNTTRANPFVGKSNSFRARTAARPDLYLQTTDAELEDPNHAPPLQSPTSRFNPYNLASPSSRHGRNSSITDRSPLQKLEMKLGDISKEEKRTRAAEAEAKMMRKHSTAKTGKPGDWTASKPATSNGIAPSDEARLGQVRSQRQARSTTHERTPSTTKPMRTVSGPAQAQTTRDIEPADETLFSGMQQGNISLPRSRTRSYAYDSSRTKNPADAAVSAYQSSRRTASGPYTSSSRGDYPDLDGSAFSRTQRGPTQVQDSGAVHSAYTPLQQDRTMSKGTEKAGSKLQQPDPLPASDVRSSSPRGPPYSMPPQTATGQRARKQVAFGFDDPNEIAGQSHPNDEQRQHRLRNMLHRGSQQERRYSGSPYKSDWRNAETATLTAQDLRLSQQPQQTQSAWWEGRNGTRTASGGSRQPQATTSAQPETLANGTYSTSTIFQPALNLRCGPLLRYTGLRRGDQESGSEFWRGSVMIVTEDASSNYSNGVPALKLFKQPMSLLPRPASRPQADNDDEEAERLSNDLTAGLPKISRTGQTLYVKPIHLIPGEVDLSQKEDDHGLFERTPSMTYERSTYARMSKEDGEKTRQFREVKGCRLHAESGLTFWRFNLEVELTPEQTRIAYRINNGPPIGFWVPAKGESMNIMFHSCNGFSMSIDSNTFSGPDPLWRDVLSSHQIRPFHCMLGGGDQLYNDRAMKETEHFSAWLKVQDSASKHSAEFTQEMQEELEHFYLNRYAMWFSQGLFGLANSQIPMVNVWDDHDIMDGYGSYPHTFMKSPVFTGIGAIAYKYYMLFQHQSIPDETSQTEPSWLLGTSPGPYINQLSRSLFMFLGHGVAFLGLDCRTERMHDEILSQETYDVVFQRCREEIIQGETKHLIVLLGVPIAYPRLNILENVLTSRAMAPVKAMGRAGMLGGFLNKFDGGVEILDDLDDHWTAKHHKHERNWFIQELQELAAEKSVRITILGGDVHLAAIGTFYSNPNLGLPKDRDHRYMPNVISSAIVNTPPPDMMADVLNKRNKIHHLDDETDEYMVPIFDYDVNGKKRNNNNLLPRRNWCSIRTFNGEQPFQSQASAQNEVKEQQQAQQEPSKRRRSFSLTRSLSRNRGQKNNGNESDQPGFLRRLSGRKAPPSAYRNPNEHNQSSGPYENSQAGPRGDGSDDMLQGQQQQRQDYDGSNFSKDESDDGRGRPSVARTNSWQQRPNTISRRQSKNDRTGRQGQIELDGGLEITLNCEVDQTDPAGFTEPYTLIVPALYYEGPADVNTSRMKGRMTNLLGSLRGRPEPQHEHHMDGTQDESAQAMGTPPPNTVGQRQLGSDGTFERDPEYEQGANGTTMVGAGAAAGALGGASAYRSKRDRDLDNRHSQQYEDAPQYQASGQSHQDPVPETARSRQVSHENSADPTSGSSRPIADRSSSGMKTPMIGPSRPPEWADGGSSPEEAVMIGPERLPDGPAAEPTHPDPTTSGGHQMNGGQSSLHRPSHSYTGSQRPTTSGRDPALRGSMDSAGYDQPRGSSDSRNVQPFQHASRGNGSTDTARPTRERRYSASGPEPPSNFDQLPSRVQKRYSQLNDPERNDHLARSRSQKANSSPNTRHSFSEGTDPSHNGKIGKAYSHGDHEIPSRVQSERKPSQKKRWSLLNDPSASKRYGQYEPEYAQPSATNRHSRQSSSSQPEQSHPAPQVRPPPNADQYYRRYATGPMEMPLLPVGPTQLRSSDHRQVQERGDLVDPMKYRSTSGPSTSGRQGQNGTSNSSAYIDSLPQSGGAPYVGHDQPLQSQDMRAYHQSQPLPRHHNGIRNEAYDNFDPSNQVQSSAPQFNGLLSRGQTTKLQPKRGSKSSRHSRNSSTHNSQQIIDKDMAIRLPLGGINSTDHNTISYAPNGNGAHYQVRNTRDQNVHYNNVFGSPGRDELEILTNSHPTSTRPKPRNLGEGGGVLSDHQVGTASKAATAAAATAGTKEGNRTSYFDSPAQSQSPTFAHPAGEYDDALHDLDTTDSDELARPDSEPVVFVHEPSAAARMNGTGRSVSKGKAHADRSDLHSMDTSIESIPTIAGLGGLVVEGPGPTAGAGTSANRDPAWHETRNMQGLPMRKDMSKHLGWDEQGEELRSRNAGRPGAGGRKLSGGQRFVGMVRRISGGRK